MKPLPIRLVKMTVLLVFPEIHSCLIHILDYCNNRGVDPTEPIELVLPKDYGAKTSYDTEITVIYDQEPVVPEVIDLEV